MCGLDAILANDFGCSHEEIEDNQNSCFKSAVLGSVSVWAVSFFATLHLTEKVIDNTFVTFGVSALVATVATTAMLATASLACCAAIRLGQTIARQPAYTLV